MTSTPRDKMLAYTPLPFTNTVRRFNVNDTLLLTRIFSKHAGIVSHVAQMGMTYLVEPDDSEVHNPVLFYPSPIVRDVMDLGNNTLPMELMWMYARHMDDLRQFTSYEYAFTDLVLSKRYGRVFDVHTELHRHQNTKRSSAIHSVLFDTTPDTWLSDNTYAAFQSAVSYFNPANASTYQALGYELFLIEMAVEGVPVSAVVAISDAVNNSMNVLNPNPKPKPMAVLVSFVTDSDESAHWRLMLALAGYIYENLTHYREFLFDLNNKITGMREAQNGKQCGLPFGTISSVKHPVLEYANDDLKPAARLTQYVKKLNTEDNKIVAVFQQGAQSSTLWHNTDGKVCPLDGKTWQFIDLPCYNMNQFHDTPEYGITPYMYATDDRMSIVEPHLRYGYESLIDGLIHDGYEDFLKRKMGLHGDYARKLELDRDYGKHVAAAIGLLVPEYAVVKTLDDWNPSDIPTDKVAIKYQCMFIGIFDKSQVAALIPQLIDPNHKDQHTLIIEEYLGTPETEINFSYMIHDDWVLPMLGLRETNKMMTNNTGSKISMSMSVHKPEWIDSEAGKEVTKCVSRLHRYVMKDANGRGMFGWVDVSLMKRDGKWYFTEWMCRNGMPNFGIINHLLKTPYMSLWQSMDKKHPLEQVKSFLRWNARLSLSTELVCIPLAGGFSVSSFFTDSLFDRAGITDVPEDGVFFDPSDTSAQHYSPLLHNTAVDVQFQNSVRYGTLTALADDIEVAKASLLNALSNVNVPYATWRTDFDSLITETP